jgi:transposase InsO family protein
MRSRPFPAPHVHAFVERLIGTIWREYLDRIWYWNQTDLERKLEDYKGFYNQYRCHAGLTGATPTAQWCARAPDRTP